MKTVYNLHRSHIGWHLYLPWIG